MRSSPSLSNRADLLDGSMGIGLVLCDSDCGCVSLGCCCDVTIPARLRSLSMIVCLLDSAVVVVLCTPSSSIISPSRALSSLLIRVTRFFTSLSMLRGTPIIFLVRSFHPRNPSPNFLLRSTSSAVTKGWSSLYSRTNNLSVFMLSHFSDRICRKSRNALSMEIIIGSSSSPYFLVQSQTRRCHG